MVRLYVGSTRIAASQRELGSLQTRFLSSLLKHSPTSFELSGKMPRGIPNARRDETGMKFTTFHVPLALVVSEITLKKFSLIMLQDEPKAYDFILLEVGNTNSMG